MKSLVSNPYNKVNTTKIFCEISFDDKDAIVDIFNFFFIEKKKATPLFKS